MSCGRGSVREFGRENEDNTGQSLKASGSIRCSFEPDSKMTSRRALHDEKQAPPIISTDFRTQIDDNDEHEPTAEDAISPTCESGSNITSSRFL
jgi:hypothetical protein